jgi:hypothetical protein
LKKAASFLELAVPTWLFEGKDASMSYSTNLTLLLASVLLTADAASRSPEAAPQPNLDDVLQQTLDRLRQLVADFCQQPLSPQAALQFEQQLQGQMRELGRLATQWTYNHIEPHQARDLPQHVCFEASLYTRLNRKTPQSVATLFGTIRLWRTGYRPSDKSGDHAIFPLAQSLGLLQGASPALAERAALYQAQAGATQKQTLQRLRQDHGVGWGVKKLRQVTAALATAMAEQRHEVQVTKLVQLLAQAEASRGPHKPVLSVGRDGITLGLQIRGCERWEVATTATVSVLDRRGRRLGTAYLAYSPEAGQKTMSQQLTRLLRAVLQAWQGPLPRLSYVTDAGDNETSYYDRVLRRMRHPRSREPLQWIRVVDYYHASARLWTMAEALLGKGRKAQAWARKMDKWLKRPNGVYRVLHSAAALASCRQLTGRRAEKYQVAYNYLRARMKYMQYAKYRRLGVPLGSGVTEAACKTVYSQRLKLSGMRWQKSGAQAILNLRVLLLSGVWAQAYDRVLHTYAEAKVHTEAGSDDEPAEMAA